MRMSTILLIVLALASVGVSAGLWLELRAERALNAELSNRLDGATAARVVAPPPIAQLPAAPGKSAAPVGPIRAPALEPPAAQPKRVTQGAPEDWQARQRKLMNDPRYREAFREQQRLRLATRRENFVRLLGFSPEQADAVIDLSIERQMAWQELNMYMASENAPQQQKERLEAQEQAYQTKLRELLGNDKSAQLQNYMESRQSRMQVDQFRTQLTGADMLREDQVEPLIAALYTEQAQMQKDLQEYRETLSWEGDATASSKQFADRQAEAMKAAHRRMHSAAAPILSQTQLERLDAMLKRDLERHEAQQRMARIQSKLEPPREAAGNSN